jgi:hypothetical protein
MFRRPNLTTFKSSNDHEFHIVGFSVLPTWFIFLSSIQTMLFFETTVSLRHHTHLAKNGPPYTNIYYHNNPTIFIAKDDLHHLAINITATIYHFQTTVNISQQSTAYNSHTTYCNNIMQLLCQAHQPYRFFQVCYELSLLRLFNWTIFPTLKLIATA